MSETTFDDRTARSSALDQFAREGEQRRGGEIVSVGAFPAPVDRVFGAQQVAVLRDEGRVLSKLKALAAAAGTDWYYRYPVKNRKENRQDWIEGPSIKLANDLARIYGNCDVDIRVQDLGDSWLFYARFIDLETGFSLTRPFQQRKSAGKIGGDDDARRLDIAFQIGSSKALRNVVVNALQTFGDFAFEEAKNALVDKIGKDIRKWREEMKARLSGRVEIKRVEAVVGRVVDEWLAPDIARVIAMMKAVQDGMASLDDSFPPLTAAATGAGAGLEQGKTGLDGFAKGGEQKSETAKQNPASDTEPESGNSSAGDDAAQPSSDSSSKSDDGDPRAEAHRRGQEARAKNLSRKAVPPEIAKDEQLKAAYLDGFDGEGLAARELGEDG